MWSRRNVIKAGAAAAATAFPGVSSSLLAQAKPESITLMTWGGLWGDGVAGNVDKRFAEKFGVKVVQDRGSSPAERITKIKVNVNNQIFDLLQLVDGMFPLAVAQDAVEPLDKSSPNYTNLPDVHPNLVHSHFLGNNYSALGICYNTKELKTPITSWADLWRPELKGRVVIPDVSHSIGTHIVAIGSIAAGKGSKDADAGFDMLKKLVQNDPIIAKDTDTIMSALTTGEAVAGLLYKSQTFTVLDRKKEPVVWAYPKEGAISVFWGTAIAKGTKNKDFAEKYMNECIAAENQVWYAEKFNYAGSNKKMNGMLEPKLRERVELSEKELADLITLDMAYMSETRAAWTDRWNRTVASR